jgi:hypothetical protein
MLVGDFHKSRQEDRTWDRLAWLPMEIIFVGASGAGV